MQATNTGKKARGPLNENKYSTTILLVLCCIRYRAKMLGAKEYHLTKGRCINDAKKEDTKDFPAPFSTRPRPYTTQELTKWPIKWHMVLSPE